LVAFDDVVALDLITRFGINLSVFDAVTGVFVDLMKTDLFSL
jgi:hypothetical protein